MPWMEDLSFQCVHESWRKFLLTWSWMDGWSQSQSDGLTPAYHNNKTPAGINVDLYIVSLPCSSHGLMAPQSCHPAGLPLQEPEPQPEVRHVARGHMRIQESEPWLLDHCSTSWATARIKREGIFVDTCSTCSSAQTLGLLSGGHYLASGPQC